LQAQHKDSVELVVYNYIALLTIQSAAGFGAYKRVIIETGTAKAYKYPHIVKRVNMPLFIISLRLFKLLSFENKPN